MTTRRWLILAAVILVIVVVVLVVFVLPIWGPLPNIDCPGAPHASGGC
jgi:hypothetical protein